MHCVVMSVMLFVCKNNSDVTFGNDSHSKDWKIGWKMSDDSVNNRELAVCSAFTFHRMYFVYMYVMNEWMDAEYEPEKKLR